MRIHTLQVAQHIQMQRARLRPFSGAGTQAVEMHLGGGCLNIAKRLFFGRQRARGVEVICYKD
jgi:hypothetical protein